MHTPGDADWDPREESVLVDQRASYDAMRERCPVAHSEYLGWSLFRHEDIQAVLDDPVTFSNQSRHRAIPNGLDAPEHTLYRQLLEPFFSSASMTRFEPICRSVARETVGALLLNAATEVEFVSTFAVPYPLMAHCAFLGWPKDCWDHLRGWNHGNQQMAFTRDRQAGRALAAEFAGYVAEMLDARRDSGTIVGNDVTTELMRAEVDGVALSDEDIVSILRNWTAGQGTVAGALANIVLYLAQHLELQQQLRDDLSLLPVAIDEILRIDDPLVMNRRTATRDIEIGSRSIGAGEPLALMWIAANRDGRVFDAPECVQLDRDPSENLVFGKGIHDCVGASMARLELRLALEELLSRTIQIEMSSTHDPQRLSIPSNGVSSLHLRLIQAI